MNLLITGADGFIGSHLTEALVRQSHNVRAFVFYNSFNSRGCWLDYCDKDVTGKFGVFTGDILDRTAFNDVWQDLSPGEASRMTTPENALEASC